MAEIFAIKPYKCPMKYRVLWQTWFLDWIDLRVQTLSMDDPPKQNWTSLWTLSKVGEGREGGYFRSIITFQVHYNFGVGLGFGVGFGLGSCVACTIDVQTLIWSAIKSTESSSLRDNDTKAEVGNCSWNCHHLFQFSHHPGSRWVKYKWRAFENTGSKLIENTHTAQIENPQE